jgi:Domain of unknown function (DUF1707)
VDASRRLWPRFDLRVGDADRKAVVDELQRHYVEGRLTSDELSERVGHTLNARTFADLAAQLSDLPALADSPSADTPPALGGYGEHQQWHSNLALPPIGLILLVVGLVLLLMVLAMPNMRFGFFPWPLFIWGFFFFGRSGRGGRHRF